MEAEAPSYIGVKVTWVAWLRRTLDPLTPSCESYPGLCRLLPPMDLASISLVVMKTFVYNGGL